jgi:cytochrome b involved in lipid metabolism
LEFFPGNMGIVFDKHGEKFPQDISQMEKRYSSKWTANILADYCWMLVQETPTEEYKKQKMTMSF